MHLSSSNATRIQRAFQSSLVDAVLRNERTAREFDMLATDLQTLHLLVLRQDVRSPKQLSQATGMPTSTVTRVLDRLEAAGYLRRVHDTTDRRRAIVELVMAKVGLLVGHYGEDADKLDKLNAEFSEEELGVVARYLEQIGATF